MCVNFKVQKRTTKFQRKGGTSCKNLLLLWCMAFLLPWGTVTENISWPENSKNRITVLPWVLLYYTVGTRHWHGVRDVCRAKSLQGKIVFFHQITPGSPFSVSFQITRMRRITSWACFSHVKYSTVHVQYAQSGFTTFLMKLVKLLPLGRPGTSAMGIQVLYSSRATTVINLQVVHILYGTVQNSTAERI